MINKQAFDELPKNLQTIIKIACATENDLMTAEYHANNIQAFNTLKHKYKVDIRRYPDSVLEAFFDMSEKVVASVADEGELEKRIYNSYKQYRQYSIDMSPYTEMTFMKARTLKT